MRPLATGLTADRTPALAPASCAPPLLPPAAMGMLLVERLRKADMTFKILEEGQAAA